MPFLDSTVAQSGRFTDIRPVGRGAAGRVYAAHDTRLNVPVAIKEVLPTTRAFQQTLEKFRKEAQIQACLRHTNIISVYDLKEDATMGEYYLVCEYANAGTLAEYLHQHGPLPELKAIDIALDICAALEKLWGEQIVHGDIKPTNILLTEDAHGVLTAKLGDLGIARGPRWRQTTMLPGAYHPGTPLYMAPEQWNVANTLDVRTDLYALGATLFEMVTGKPYKSLLSDTALPDVRQHTSQASLGIAQVIQRAVQADPSERYQTPQELAHDLKCARRGAQLLRTLARPQAQELSDARWQYDVDRLMTVLRRMLRDEDAKWRQGQAGLAALVSLIVLVAILLAWGVVNWFPTCPYPWTRDLWYVEGKRMQGEDVRELQRRLKAFDPDYNLGTTGPNRDGIDADFGEKTKRAVEEFQQANDLPINGIVGPETQAALDKVCP